MDNTPYSNCSCNLDALNEEVPSTSLYSPESYIYNSIEENAIIKSSKLPLGPMHHQRLQKSLSSPLTSATRKPRILSSLSQSESIGQNIEYIENKSPSTFTMTGNL